MRDVATTPITWGDRHNGIAAYEPNSAAHLYDAAAYYAREDDLMWGVWNCVGGTGRSPDRKERFKHPAVRRRMFEIIRDPHDQDRLAVGYLESAYAAIGI